MKYTYISIDGNIKESEDVTHMPSFLEKIDNSYFEKRSLVKEEVVIEKREEVVIEIDATLVEKAKEYCKEHKVRGYGLLKDQKLIDTAVANGFIL